MQYFLFAGRKCAVINNQVIVGYFVEIEKLLFQHFLELPGLNGQTRRNANFSNAHGQTFGCAVGDFDVQTKRFGHFYLIGGKTCF